MGISVEWDGKVLPSPTIQHRKLTHPEAVTLHHELKTTPNILGFTVRELVRLRDVQVAEVEGVFVGACWSFDLPRGWTEIAAIYVLPAYRGAGLGQRLMEAAWARAVSRQRHLYMLSRNLTVIAWMRERGMIVNSRMLTAPLPIQLWMAVYMASWHRNKEAVRKSKMMKGCPPLVQGIKRWTE